MLVGRDSELDRLGALVSAARAGRGGALVVSGPAGIGKSALLDAVASDAAGLPVVRTSGVQAERDVPYAGLHALLSALVSGSVLDALPEAQARGLSVALGRAEGPTPGRLVLGAAVLGVLGAQESVLVVVDDLQWLDVPSADALCFAARRLVADPVALILGLRTEGPPDLGSPTAGLPRLDLTGLTEPAGLLPGAHPHVLATLVRATAGNPLALLETAAALTPEELSGAVPLPRQLPPTNVEGVYAARLTDLPGPARAAARVAALAGRAPAHVLDLALHGAGLRAEDLAPLETLGLCRVVGSLRWRHPLARAAAARGTTTELRAAHGVLADAWGEVHPVARAWHLAEAARGVDPVAADAMEQAARQAERADASADAADAWERAAQLSGDRADRARLLEAAAVAALRAGVTPRASGLLDQALQLQPGADRVASLLRQRGRIEHTLGNPHQALHLFVQAVDLAPDRATRVWAAAEGLYSAMYAGRPDEATRMAQLARAHHDATDPVQAFLVAHADGAAASLRGDRHQARAGMDEARTLLRTGLLRHEPALALWAVNLELFDPSGDELDPELLTVLDAMRAVGDLTWLPRVSRLVAVRQIAQGRWADVQGWLDEAEIVSRMSGQRTQLVEALLLRAEVDAFRGHREQCLRDLAESRELMADLAIPWLTDGLRWVGAVDLLTCGREAEAADLLRTLHGQPSTLLLLVELVLRTSGSAAAAAELDSERDAPPVERALAEALLDPDERRGAEALATRAAAGSWSFESAILRVLAGERLRRLGERRAAREQLRAALDAFTRAGATPWVDRVETELRATGATLRRRPEHQELTPSERRIATMVADGLSNKQVASTLYLSPKTVEFHLSRIYRKLGVANRTALSRALGG